VRSPESRLSDTRSVDDTDEDERVTRITTIRPADASDELRQARAAQHALYPPEYEAPVLPEDDEIAGIVAAHSLIPAALHHAFATFGSLMSPDLPLTRRQHEMIATVVSAANRTHYCTMSHTEFLRRVTLDETFAAAIRDDFRSVALDPADRAMLEYAEQVTGDATGVTDEHHDALRNAGFDDRGILQITLIAAWFNYINRVADALGVGTT
jgi:uncharacterized peroxidase-related enzyme